MGYTAETKPSVIHEKDGGCVYCAVTTVAVTMTRDITTVTSLY